DDVASKLARFAHAKAADSISREADVDGPSSRLATQLRVHSALHNAEQRLRVGTGLFPVQAGRSPASTRSLSMGTAGPRDFLFVLFKITLAALSPAQCQFHRVAYTLSPGRILGAFVEGHDDVGSQADLRLHGLFGTQKVRGAVQVRAERHPLFADFPEIVQAENLEAARVRENSSIPRHEPVQPAHPANRFNTRTQIKMIGIAEQNLDVKFFEHILRDALDRSQGSDRHEHRRLYLSVRSDQLAGAGGPSASINLQANSHRRILT